MRELPEPQGAGNLPIVQPGLASSIGAWTSLPTAASQRSEPDRYWQILKRRRWVVLAVTLFCILMASIIAIRTPRVYVANALIGLSMNQQQQGVSALSSFLPIAPASSEISTDVVLIKTQAVMEYTSRQLQTYGMNIPAVALVGMVNAAAVPDTSLILITALYSDPQGAAKIANATGEGFAQYQIDQAEQTGSHTQKFLTAELDDARQKLARAELTLQHFREMAHISGSGQSAPSTVSGTDNSVASAVGETNQGPPIPGLGSDLRTTQSALSDALAQQASQQIRVDVLRSRINDLNSLLMSRHSSAIQDNGLVKSLQQQLDAKQDELATARAQYTAQGVQHFFPGLEQEVQTLRTRIRSQLSNLTNGDSVDLDQEQALNTQLFQAQVDLEALRPQINELQKRVQKMAEQMANQPRLETRYNQLMRDRDVMERVYTLLLERQKQAEISQSAAEGGASIKERATPIYKPFRPNRREYVTVGLMLGLILGYGLAFLLEYLDNSLKTPDDISSIIGIPALGAIPPSVGQSSILWRNGPRSWVTESYRMLRSNIGFISLDSPIHTLLITSPEPDEGKSMLTANLACAIAQSNRRVVVVDADLRKPGQFAYLGGGRTIGLAEVLSGTNTLEEALRETEFPGVWTIPVDEIPDNPAELLGGDRMINVIARLRDQFDVVLIDTPPCLAVTDARTLAALADGVLLVIASGKTSRESAIRAREAMTNAHGRVVGAVLNRFSGPHPATHDYYPDDPASHSIMDIIRQGPRVWFRSAEHKR